MSLTNSYYYISTGQKMSALQFLDCIDIPSRSALNKNKKIL